VTSRLGGEVTRTGIEPDEEASIRAFVQEAVASSCDLVLTTGGTGFAPRDRTPEAVARLLDRRAENLMELARLRCKEITPFTYLSRGVSGTIGATLVVTLPGSPRGACETLEAMIDLIPHAIDALRSEEDHA
ncbi:MAG: MogA/MoaB family molybdenum cofactor biosynthesis protein, partial [Phycisphaerales bacterium]|nr:MogA/MoaB family molybdenum cofactor biosynthesis protein [Phycisphaerales bacterium]